MDSDRASTILVTPELALVDPDLGRAARAALADPPDCLAIRPSIPSAARVHGATVRARAIPSPVHGRRFERWAAVAAWLVLAAFVGSSFLAFIGPTEIAGQPTFDRDVEGGLMPSGTTPAERRAETMRTSKRSRPTVPAPKPAEGVLLRWPSVKRASLYNVVIMAGGRRVDAWPTRNRYRFSAPSGVSAAKGLATIPFRWFVYPAYRNGDGFRFGPLLAKGAAQVVAPRSS